MVGEETHGAAGYQQRVTDVHYARLEELARVLELGRATYFGQGDLFSWTAQPNSVGAAEHAAAAANDALANMATHAPAVASLMIRTAAEQLAGLAAILRSGEVFGACEPVVRSVLENSAYACWVIDLKATGRQRGARVLAAELTTVSHLLSALERIDGPGNAESIALTARINQLEALAAELYPPFNPPGGRYDHYTVGGERYPRFTAAVIAWADSAGGGRVSGGGLYGWLCSDTHPKALAARLNWQRGSTSTTVEQRIELSQLDDLVTAALHPFHSALVCLATYNGWLGNPALAQFETTCDAIVPGSIH